LQECRVPIVAVSPIVGGDAIKGPLAKMMREMSLPSKAAWIAEHYRDFLSGFIIDTVDSGQSNEIEAMGIATVATNIVMKTLQERVDLASECLEFTAWLSEGGRASPISAGRTAGPP
jgi:LPPG:FO 2-phospho-L-lactate transferase